MGCEERRAWKSSHWIVAGLAAVIVLFAGYSQAGEPEPEPEQAMIPMAPFTLEDQHGNEHTLDPSVRAILYSRDRKGGFVMTRSMEGRDGEFLGERGVLYINDISSMPAYAATLFALPKMRRRTYPILLDRTSEVTASFPDQDGKASLIHLDDMKIREVEYFADSDVLAARMEKLPKAD